MATVFRGWKSAARAYRSRPGLALIFWLVSGLLGAGLAQPVPHDGVPGGAQWVAGDFIAAYELSAQLDTAAAQLLAARAAADQAVYVETDTQAAQAWLRRSEAAATRAIELEPAGPLAAAANMALARAKGELALYRGALSNTGIPGELRALFERALELDPANADALVAFGAWHLELSERGVGWLYGGSRDRVLPLMERGVAEAPKQVNLRVEYAVALAALGREGMAREQLGIALSLPAGTRADEHEQDRARELLGAL